MGEDIASWEGSAEEIPVNKLGQEYIKGHILKFVKVPSGFVAAPVLASMKVHDLLTDNGDMFVVKMLTADFLDDVVAPVDDKIENLEELIALEPDQKGSYDEMSEEFQKTVQGYINSLRKFASQILPDKVGQQIIVIEFEKGFIVDIKADMFLSNYDKILPKAGNISAAFNALNVDVSTLGNFKLEQKANDTEVFNLPKDILLIKGSDNKWTTQQASDDLQLILQSKTLK